MADRTIRMLHLVGKAVRVMVGTNRALDAPLPTVPPFLCPLLAKSFVRLGRPYPRSELDWWPLDDGPLRLRFSSGFRTHDESPSPLNDRYSPNYTPFA